MSSIVSRMHVREGRLHYVHVYIRLSTSAVNFLKVRMNTLVQSHECDSCLPPPSSSCTCRMIFLQHRTFSPSFATNAHACPSTWHGNNNEAVHDVLQALLGIRETRTVITPPPTRVEQRTAAATPILAALTNYDDTGVPRG